MKKHVQELGFDLANNDANKAKTANEVVQRLVNWAMKAGLGRWMPHTPHLYDALGLSHRGTTIHKGLFGHYYSPVAGVMLRVYASNMKRRLHRVFILCPECGWEVDAGHFYQHSCCLKCKG